MMIMFLLNYLFSISAVLHMNGYNAGAMGLNFADENEIYQNY
jgi:hypothetical protein